MRDLQFSQGRGQTTNSLVVVNKGGLAPIGNRISRVELVAYGDGAVRLTFEDGRTIEICDNGRSCCENRYITTDDDLASLVGHVLIRIDAKDGPESEADGEPHETCFIEIGTDQNFVTLVTHNEHNGYYGGFDLTIREIEPTAP
ncbi:MAG: hypothetical protein JWO51_103 [Rhodospirillales bacterium]|nr:hypothetical protein [Rhodospirillales bacterium]